MFAVISRSYEAAQTKGVFAIFDEDTEVAQVKSLELPFLQNKPNISCIPAGEYECERYLSETFGICFLVKDVPGRSEIVIHAGNFAAGDDVDTRGCILVGLRFVDINADGNIDVKDSGKAMSVLRAILPKSFKLIIR